MTTANRELQPRDGWMPAIAMLTIALLSMAALLNGVGAVGVMAPAHPGKGQFVEVAPLSAAEQVAFAGVDRAIERLHLEASGQPEQFEAYEPLLLALAESLPTDPDGTVLARVQKLLSGSLPDPAATDIMAVLPSFLSYQQAEKALLGLSWGVYGGIEGAYLHTQIQNALRETILGEAVTADLYSTSYRMTEIHLVRQMLMERQDLNEEEKRRRIQEQMEALRTQDQPESTE